MGNDPGPCVSHQYTTFEGLDTGDVGHLLHGSPNHDYNADLNCKWHLKTISGLKTFEFVVNFFDVQDTQDCTADSMLIGRREDSPSGVFCGSRNEGDLLASVWSDQVFVTFATDSFVEGRGFNVTFTVKDRVR